jgi:tetratricopeptide (TPR) repeat protein
MTGSLPQALPSFVDRVEELARIDKVLEEARGGKGQLLLVRGEAGIGKTRLVQEALGEAERRGFAVALGTAYSESLKPYHPWRDLLRGLGLSHLLEERPPPKLEALYAWTGDSFVPAERVAGETDQVSLRAMRTEFEDFVRKSLLPSESARSEGRLSWIDHDPYQLCIQRGEDCGVGAVIQGKADEVFFSDLRGLADKIAPGSRGNQGSAEASAGSHASVAALLREILESGKYEGIDYARNDPKLRQARFFENFSLGLSRSAELRPVLAVLDDLQWADPSSLALLHYAARNTRASNVLLLGAYRMEEGGVRPHLRDALQRRAQEELSSEVSIEGLRREDLDRLVESFGGPFAFPASFLDLLWRETQGNPLFVREVLLGLEEDGALRVQGGAKRLVRPVEQLALSRRVRDVIRARLARLSKEDRELLDAAAACGTRFTAALVAGVAGEGEGKVMRGLNSIASVHGILRPAGEEFVFNHALVHEVVYEDTPVEARKAYHLQAAEWIETVGGPQEEVAFHYFRSEERERALPLLLNLAERAAGLFSNAEAIRFYSEALELERDPSSRMRIFEKIGSVCRLTGDLQGALGAYESALALAEDDAKRAELLAKEGDLHHRMGDFDLCIELCRKALSLVGERQCREAAAALETMGWAHYRIRGEFDEALRYFEGSLRIREAEQDEEGIASCLNAIGAVHVGKVRYPEARKYHERALAIRKKLGDQSGVAGSLNNIGMVHQSLGEYDEALAQYFRSVEISQRIGNQQYLASHLNNIGSVYNDRGELSKAVEYHGRSLALYEKIGNRPYIASSLYNIGLIHTARGDFDEAMQILLRSKNLYEKLGSRGEAAHAQTAIGGVFVERGEFDRALETLSGCQVVFEELEDSSALFNCLCSTGKAHLHRGDPGKALTCFREASELAERIGARWGLSDLYSDFAAAVLTESDLVRALELAQRAVALAVEMDQKGALARARRILGVIERERGHLEDAIKQLEEALHICEETGHRVDVGRTRYQLGLTWARLGQVEKSRAYLASAADLFATLGMPIELGKAKEASNDVAP